MPNLCAIARIFKNYDVICIERYVALTAALTEKDLRDEKYTEILMMSAFGKEIHDRVARRRFPHKIIDYH